MRKRSLDISTIVLVAIVLGTGAGFFGAYYYIVRGSHTRSVAEAERAQQEAVHVPILSTTSTVEKKPAGEKKIDVTTTSTQAVSMRGAFNLDIAFFPQAPQKVWDVRHEDYCEEASLLGVHAFLKQKKFTVDQMESELLKMHDFEIKTFGYFESTSIEQTARIAREYLGYKKVRIIENPTIEMIRAEVAAGHPVLVPANGKVLKNPYFKNGGPSFHMFIVRGFTENGDVITNDPGTQHGENFVYKKEVVLAAMHDWDHVQDATQVATGSPRVLVIE